MKIEEFTKELKRDNACGEALLKIRHYQTAQEWWDDTGRGDWMLWLIGKKAGKPWSDKRKKLVLTACKCARLTLPYVESDETRPLIAIETAEQWARGENSITIQDVRAADAAANAYTAYTADAPAAAAYVADAADAAATAAYVACAAVAAAAAYAYTARKKTLAKCADIVRKDYPNIDAILTL